MVKMVIVYRHDFEVFPFCLGLIFSGGNCKMGEVFGVTWSTGYVVPVLLG